MSHDSKRRADELKDRSVSLAESLRLGEQKERLRRAEEAMASAGFWDKPEEARKPVVEELKLAKAVVEPMERLSQSVEDAVTLAELTEEDGTPEDQASLEAELERLEHEMLKAELRAMLKGSEDHRNCYLSIQSGAGGTDACDWAEMLLRMYSMFIEGREGFSAELISVDQGDEAGIKNAVMHVKGPYAFGYLQGERGVHRLVRISPFDAAKRRHTAFAAVDVVAEFDEDVEIEILDKELRVDTYRSGGAGGQHVNVTDSAVRITHLPTGVVVACQNERSQHANRRTAMKLLKAKLHQLETARRDEEQAKLYGNKGEIAWGNQIRSYVLQPYTMCKDLRTDCETSSVDRVLDGDIDAFLDAYLRYRMTAGKQ